MRVDNNKFIEFLMSWGPAGRPAEGREVHVLPPRREGAAQLFLQNEDEFSEEAITLTVPEACALLPVLKKFIGVYAGPGDETTPGAAAFETWVQTTQISSAGGRQDYWEDLTAVEKAQWEEIAKAARNPTDPFYRPVPKPGGS